MNEYPYFDATYQNKTTDQTNNVLGIAEKMYYMSKNRDILLDKKNIFGNTAWSIILHLFIARYNKSIVYVADIDKITNIPITTALRWLKELESEKLVIRNFDHRAQLTSIDLSSKGFELLYSYFMSCI